MKKSATNTEVDFLFKKRLQEVRDDRMSIEDFLRLIEFEKWLLIFCHGYDFKIFEGQYESRDLQQESRRKVVKSVPELEPDNTPNEGAFFGWLNTLVFYTYLDVLRRHGKALKHGWSRSDKPIEGVAVPAPAEDYDGKHFLRQYLKFIKVYSPERQFAIMLWLLEDRSYREIQELLRGEGIKVSHVTVGNWVMASLAAFRESLGLPRPE